MKWYQRLLCGLLLLASLALFSSSASAALSLVPTPETQLRSVDRQLKVMLVRAPAGWMMVREYDRYERLLQKKASLIPPHKAEWLCIHGYEGSWTDPNPPFWGGLQMDSGFQKTYGPELLRRYGTADHWSPLQQMWVAERAHVSRGFYPWPNTAHYCGLI